MPSFFNLQELNSVYFSSQTLPFPFSFFRFSYKNSTRKPTSFRRWEERRLLSLWMNIFLNRISRRISDTTSKITIRPKDLSFPIVRGKKIKILLPKKMVGFLFDDFYYIANSFGCVVRYKWFLLSPSLRCSNDKFSINRRFLFYIVRNSIFQDWFSVFRHQNKMNF